jgi:hypothetical protein
MHAGLLAALSARKPKGDPDAVFLRAVRVVIEDLLHLTPVHPWRQVRVESQSPIARVQPGDLKCLVSTGAIKAPFGSYCESMSLDR